MKEKMSKLFEIIKANKMMTIGLSVCAVVTVVSAAVGIHAIANNPEFAPADLPNSKPSETTVVDGISSEPSENAASDKVIEDTEDIKRPSSNTSTDAPSSQNNITNVSSKLPEAHEHAYTKKVVKATCTQDGYTKYTCKCGETYKDNETKKLGHDYSEWEIIKEATTTTKGEKKCVCERCGETKTKTIAKKEAAYNIDSRVEIGTALFSGIPEYTLKKCKINDKRTWGEPPIITVDENDCMHVTYYNQKGEKIQFTAPQPATKDTTNGFVIKNDGTYYNLNIGSYT